MIKEIPILFSTPMVQAILEGRKTQTRRLMKPQPWYGSQVPGGPHFIYPPGSGNRFNADVSKNGNWYVMEECSQRRFSKMAKWQPSDVLWVRESFRVNTWVPDDGEISFRYEADGATSHLMMVDWEESECERFNKYWEQSCDDLTKAGYEPGEDERYADYDYKALRLRPNIFFLKEAARIWVQVESVRVERLQDISEEDAKAEGVKTAHCESNEGCPSQLCKEKCAASGEWWNYLAPDGEGFPAASAKESFESLWQSINGTDSWKANPWVWVVSFKVISTTGKPDNI
jgi:hypothetical protein